MNTIYLLLGSNMGKSLRQMQQASKYIANHIGKIKRRSGMYQTAAWGKTDQPDFLNQVLIVETGLSASDTMQTILAIEKKMGRERTEKNAPRIIDIDILFYNKDIISRPHLIIPHPRIPDRQFVLNPLNELSPNLKHPVLNKTIHQLLRICPDKLPVKKI